MTTYDFKMLVWPTYVAIDSGTTVLVEHDGTPTTVQIHLISLRNKSLSRRRVYLYMLPSGEVTLNESFADFYIDPDETVFVEFDGSKALVLGEDGDSFHAIADAADSIVVMIKGVEITTT